MEITRGSSGIDLAYLIALSAMIFALMRERAPWGTMLLSPLVALPVMLLGALLIAMTSFLLEGFGFVGHLLRIPYGITVMVMAGYVGGRALAGYRSGPVAHRRGTIVDAEVLLAAPARDSGVPGGITLAGVPIPFMDETKHFKLIGTTGTGKSTGIRQILEAALARGDRAVIADPDGGYLARFYDPGRGDVLLNPFQPGAHKWALYREATRDQDIDALARALIPDHGGSDREWAQYGRVFFSEVMRQTIRCGAPYDQELLRLVQSAGHDELRALLAGTPAGPYLAKDNERMFESVRSVTSSALRSLQSTVRQQAPLFSVREWVRGETLGHRGGVLFFPYKATEIDALRSVISAWMRLAIYEAMGREEADQRMWFIVDELDALGAIDGLKDALARLRKFGGRCVLGFQSIAQVSGTYGRAAAETIVENCANTLILRCSASEHGGTAEFASQLIGQREVLETVTSSTRHPLNWMASQTTTRRSKMEQAVLPSEIEQLADLEGFLKNASSPMWRRVRLIPSTQPLISRAPTARPMPPPAAEASEAGREDAPPPPTAAPAPIRRPRAPRKNPSRGGGEAAPASAPDATASSGNRASGEEDSPGDQEG